MDMATEKLASCTVEYLGSIRGLTGRNSDVLYVKPGTTLREIMNMLAEKHGTRFKQSIETVEGTLRANVLLLFNGKNMNYGSDLNTSIDGDSEGKIITLVPVEEGGSQA